MKYKMFNQIFLTPVFVADYVQNGLNFNEIKMETMFVQWDIEVRRSGAGFR